MKLKDIILFGVDEEGRAYIYDEIYESGLIVSEAAERICRKKTEDMIFIAPADLWSRQKDSGKSVADLFAQGGVYLTKPSPSLNSAPAASISSAAAPICARVLRSQA